MRRKLKPHGLVISTVWGTGYLMSPTDRERTVKMLEDFTASDGVAEVIQ
jgi:hypothetical protein